MKSVLVVFVFCAAALSAFGAQVVKLVREPGVVAFSLQKGFGIQKDARNELTFTSVATGKPLKTVKVFTGTVAAEDKKYFSRLNAIDLPVNSGKVRVSGRIFYCSFEQKFCSVQKVDQEL